MYSKWRLLVNVLHSMSSACGGVVVVSFCRPISAMSLLKSPHNIVVMFGCALICCVMFCWISGMY